MSYINCISQPSCHALMFKRSYFVAEWSFLFWQKSWLFWEKKENKMLISKLWVTVIDQKFNMWLVFTWLCSYDCGIEALWWKGIDLWGDKFLPFWGDVCFCLAVEDRLFLNLRYLLTMFFFFFDTVWYHQTQKDIA